MLFSFLHARYFKMDGEYAATRTQESRDLHFIPGWKRRRSYDLWVAHYCESWVMDDEYWNTAELLGIMGTSWKDPEPISSQLQELSGAMMG